MLVLVSISYTLCYNLRVNPAIRTNLETWNISPRLLSAYLFAEGFGLHRNQTLESRYVYDYEMEFILEGGGSQLIGDVRYPVQSGDILFRKPGQVTQGTMPYNCFCIIFDMEGTFREGRDGYVLDRKKSFQPDFRNELTDHLPPIFHPAQPDLYRQLFETILRHAASPVEGSELLIRASILQLLFQFLRDIRDPLLQLDPGKSTAVRSVISYLRRHLAEPLHLADMAKVAGISVPYLHRLFTEAVGKTPLEYLTGLRMDKARELLAATDLTIGLVAEKTGFEQVPYFCTRFRQITGESPGDFRKKHRFPFVR